MLDIADLYMGEFGDGGRGEVNPATGRPVYDCWGLVMAAMDRLGVTVPDFYEEHDDADAIDGRFEQETATGKWERLEAPEAPCVIAIKRHPRAVKCVNHFGVYVGGGKFLHILKDRGAHLTPLKNLPARQLAGFWRWRG